MNTFFRIKKTQPLKGTIEVCGAKNAVLVIMASLILAPGKSTLRNVPVSSDVLTLIDLLRGLGADITFDTNRHTLEVDTSTIMHDNIPAAIMKKMRASVLVMGPLLARFGRATIALPGGCSIGKRPIDFHLKAFRQMGVRIEEEGEIVRAQCQQLQSKKIVLEYPSVGATENIIMAATLTKGTTTIIDAAVEPEVQDLIKILQAMGANITTQAPATIIVEGVQRLNPVDHSILPDRLEAGSLLVAAAITGGEVMISNARSFDMDVFLLKLQEMGHTVISGDDGKGVYLKATKNPIAISFKTGPFPGFPTDLQAPMMAALALAEGQSIIDETVFENRMLHVDQLVKMGAQIEQTGSRAIITGVPQLIGTTVAASDIRASCALVLAGLVAEGTTIMTNIHHFDRGYDNLDEKLIKLGASIERFTEATDMLDAITPMNRTESTIKEKNSI
jgi:UDP-N-acetylglucosamine 1-carboxyvinyltransferase